MGTADEQVPTYQRMIEAAKPTLDPLMGNGTVWIATVAHERGCSARMRRAEPCDCWPVVTFGRPASRQPAFRLIIDDDNSLAIEINEKALPEDPELQAYVASLGAHRN